MTHLQLRARSACMGHESTQRGRAGELEHKLRARAEEARAGAGDRARAVVGARPRSSCSRLIMEKVTLLMEADRSTLFLRQRRRPRAVVQGHCRAARCSRSGSRSARASPAGSPSRARWSTSPTPTPTSASSRRSICGRATAPARSSACRCATAWAQIIGVLQVLNKQDGPFTGEDEELLAALAAQAAVSIENSKLYHSVVAKNVELLARAGEARAAHATSSTCCSRSSRR